MLKSNNPVLSVKDLDYKVLENQILKGLSFEVQAGEFIGLIGPNGAGKTTLLKCLNGIYKAGGQIVLEKENIRGLSARDIAKKAALMHQNITINFPFSALDIVLMGRYPYLDRVRGESKRDYELARKYMEYTGTDNLENRPINRMSGGERQRVMFAKTLAQETELILLDEPTASLDIAYEEQIFKISKELCGKGRTVIAAVHDLKIASRYCSRLILMKEGEIIADGPVDVVLNSQNLSKSYGVNALVYRNRVTGMLDFHIHESLHPQKETRIHIIGGGGSASGVIRYLFELGYQLSAGVFAYGDSDLNCAQVYGIGRIACMPFSEIDNKSHKENIRMVKNADAVVLCNMPFGRQNIRNLEAASFAKKLIIIEDEGAVGRDYTDGEATEKYNSLRENSIVVTYARLHEVL